MSPPSLDRRGKVIGLCERRAAALDSPGTMGGMRAPPRGIFCRGRDRGGGVEDDGRDGDASRNVEVAFDGWLGTRCRACPVAAALDRATSFIDAFALDGVAFGALSAQLWSSAEPRTSRATAAAIRRRGGGGGGLPGPCPARQGAARGRRTRRESISVRAPHALVDRGGRGRVGVGKVMVTASKALTFGYPGLTLASRRSEIGEVSVTRGGFTIGDLGWRLAPGGVERAQLAIHASNGAFYTAVQTSCR